MLSFPAHATLLRLQLITDEYGVSLTQLLAANPGLDSDCGNLKAGEVGIILTAVF